MRFVPQSKAWLLLEFKANMQRKGEMVPSRTLLYESYRWKRKGLTSFGIVIYLLELGLNNGNVSHICIFWFVV